MSAARLHRVPANRIISPMSDGTPETAPFPFARADYPLAPATRYNIGGPARLALLPETEDDAAAAHAWMLRQPGPHLVLGGGSNVLVADAGFPGIVLLTTRLTRLDDLGGDRWRAGAGLALSALVRDVMLARNYAGVGALTGIPGSVGGAIFMNAGTVNGSACQFLETADLLGAGGRRAVVLTPDLYDYRSQRFCGPDDVILGGVFRFFPSPEDQRPVFEHYMARRREKQPRGFCCGSVFKNPPGDHAGRLIEACGLKGERRGGAVISPLHANFIMNEDGATFADVMALIQLVKERVRGRFGVTLEEEVRVVAPE